ncbi:DUF2934 domain-containing protein [Horticoccus luteus]|uniref:DUF2934 domain-containing protein n=2 Tax=Horticoccus luteus TaxID=2862869 RepID=A0A8F9TTC8_9BACT|nr:DUF2934 domain-containing protein [Horticoccus luteus]
MRNKKTRTTTRLFTPAATTPRLPTHDEVAARAHSIWVEQGCPHGRHVEHWTEAERQLREPLAQDDLSKQDVMGDSRDADGIMTNRVGERLDDTLAPERRASATSL